MKKTTLTSSILIISFLNVYSQSNWNLDFEIWDESDTTSELWHDTTIVENRIGLFPPNWHYDPKRIPEGTGLGRTTDNTNGKYAVALSGFYQYETMKITSGADPLNPGWAINYKPLKLTGDYKAILLGDCDSLRTKINIWLTSYNNDINKSAVVAQSEIILNESENYTEFSLDINYTNNLNPDTVVIELSKTRYGIDSPPDCLECSHVFFDNLQLHESIALNNEEATEFNPILYPNPAKDKLFLFSADKQSSYSYKISSINGQLVDSGLIESTQKEFEITKLVKGIYIVALYDQNGKILNTIKVIKE